MGPCSFRSARMSGSRYDARAEGASGSSCAGGKRPTGDRALPIMPRHGRGMLPPCAGVERFQTEVDASASRHPRFLAAVGFRPRPSSPLLRGRRRGEVRASTATARTATVGRKHFRAYKGDGSTLDDARHARAVRRAGSVFRGGADDTFATCVESMRTSSSAPGDGGPRFGAGNRHSQKKRAWTSPGPGEGARGYIVTIRTSGGR